MLKFLKKYLLPEKLSVSECNNFLLGYNRWNLEFGKFMLFIIFVFNAVYYWLDYIFIESNYVTVWILRTIGLTIPTLVLIVMFYFYRDFSIANYQILIFVYLLWMSFAIILMIGACRNSEKCLNLYFVGINIINSLAIVFKLRIKWSLWIYWLTLVVYGFMIIFYYHFPFDDIFAHLLFFTSFSTSFTFGTLYIEKYAISTYLGEQIIIKQRDELRQKNEEINQQREELLVVNQKLSESKKILEQYINVVNDSITYASRLQSALLPKKEILSKFFKYYSLEFRPRDMLSGDFYWWRAADKKLYLAIGDGTGHSISGAFMSIMGITLLNNYFDLLQKGKISDYLKSFYEHLEELFITKVSDSIDIALFVFDLEQNKLIYSGYGISMLVISKEEHLIGPNIRHYANGSGINLYELKPTRVPYGLAQRREKQFIDVEFSLSKGDRIVIFTDGFIDQINSEGVKLGKARLRKHIFLTSQKSFEEFFDSLIMLFERWKGQEKQLDDVLIFAAEI